MSSVSQLGTLPLYLVASSPSGRGAQPLKWPSGFSHFFSSSSLGNGQGFLNAMRLFSKQLSGGGGGKMTSMSDTGRVTDMWL